MIPDYKYIDGVRYTLYGTVAGEGHAIICAERAREKGFRARRFKDVDIIGDEVYVVYVLKEG